jgi:hypothetical protein
LEGCKVARTFDIITLGVAILALGLSVVVLLLNFISIWELVPMFLTIIGSWIIATAGIKAMSKISPYERQPFSTAGLGLVVLAIGASWWLYARGVDLVYVILTLTLIIGILVIVAGAREWTKK